MRRKIASIPIAALFLLIGVILLDCILVCGKAEARAGGRKWAVVVGINEYMKEVTPLRCAINDAERFRKTLIEKGGFAENDVYLLTSSSKGNRIPDKSNIIRWVSYVNKNANADDTFIFFFSGHGMDLEGSSYLLTYEADPFNKFTLDMSALKVSDLKKIIQELQVGKVLLFIDACRNDPRAGKGEADNVLTEAQSKNLIITSGYKKSESTGEGGNFSLTFFSCKVGQRSYEWSEQGMGFFTYYLVKGLNGDKGAIDNGGNVTLGSLKSYLGKEVAQAVQRERGTGMNQNVMIQGDESADADHWVVSKSGGGPVIAHDGKGAYKSTGSNLSSGREKAEQCYSAGDDHYYTMKGYLDIGNIDDAKKEYEKALESYTEAIEQYPEFAEAYASRGLVYSEAQDYQKALSDCNRAVEINAESAMAYNNRSIVYFHMGDHDKTISDCTKATEIDPELPNALNMRGFTYLKKGEFDRAIADFTSVLKIDHKNFYAFDFRGRVYAKKGQFDRAIEDFSRAVAFRPRYAPAWFNRAVAHYQSGAYEKALADCNMVIELNPREAPVYQMKAAVCQKLGRSKEAQEAQKKYEELSSKKKSTQENKNIDEKPGDDTGTKDADKKLEELEERLKRMEGK